MSAGLTAEVARTDALQATVAEHEQSMAACDRAGKWPKSAPVLSSSLCFLHAPGQYFMFLDEVLKVPSAGLCKVAIWA